MTERRFGSIRASFSASRVVGEVATDETVLHIVADPGQCEALQRFWRYQAAPAAPAIVEALRWIRRGFESEAAS